MKKLINKYQAGDKLVEKYKYGIPTAEETDNRLYQSSFGTMLPEVKVNAERPSWQRNLTDYDLARLRSGQINHETAKSIAQKRATGISGYMKDVNKLAWLPNGAMALAGGLSGVLANPYLWGAIGLGSAAQNIEDKNYGEAALDVGLTFLGPELRLLNKGVEATLKSGKGLILNYKNNLNFVNEVNKYFWEYPKLKPSISIKITNNRVKQRIAEDNTFLRGVRSSPDTEEVDKILKERYGIYNPTEDDRLKFYATHFAGNTKHGRAGIPKELLDNNIGTLYTSNSAGTAYGYNTVNTRGLKLGELDGKVALVRRPYKLGNDRKNWLKESHIGFRSTDDLDFLTTPNFENGFWTKERSLELFNLKLDEINPELKKLNLIEGAYTHNYKTLISNGYSEQEASNILNNFLNNDVHNKALNKLFQKYHVLPDLNSSEAIDFMKNNMFTTEDIMSKEDYLKKLHHVNEHNKVVRNPKHKLPDINMYQHYIFLGEPNTKGLDFIEWYDPGKNFKSGYRAHKGKNTKGLSRRLNRGESE